jgi:hypothetical protein
MVIDLMPHIRPLTCFGHGVYDHTILQISKRDPARKVVPGDAVFHSGDLNYAYFEISLKESSNIFDLM